MQTSKNINFPTNDDFRIGMSFQKVIVRDVLTINFGYPEEPTSYVTVNNNQ